MGYKSENLSLSIKLADEDSLLASSIFLLEQFWNPLVVKLLVCKKPATCQRRIALHSFSWPAWIWESRSKAIGQSSAAGSPRSSRQISKPNSAEASRVRDAQQQLPHAPYVICFLVPLDYMTYFSLETAFVPKSFLRSHQNLKLQAKRFLCQKLPAIARSLKTKNISRPLKIRKTCKNNIQNPKNMQKPISKGIENRSKTTS